MINRIEKGILVSFFEILPVSSTRFIAFAIGNVILFKIKVFGRNVKETTLARYFIKVNAGPIFTRLRVHIDE